TLAGNQLTKYKIMWAPASAGQNNPAAYVLIDEFTEDELTEVFNICEERVVNLDTYEGQQGYIAFVREHTQTTELLEGDRWLLDKIRIVEQCPAPTDLGVGIITQTSAQLQWT